jgi:hypothetical protein
MSDPIERIEAALAKLGAEHEPPAGWEARVLAATSSPRRRPWWLFAVPAAVLAAAVLVFFVGRRAPGPGPVAEAEGAIELSKQAVASRGGGRDLVPGVPLEIRVKGRQRYRALWIYRGERFEGACTESGELPAGEGGVSCKVSASEIIAEFVVKRGKYQFVSVYAASPLPAPPRMYDEGEAARQAGAHIGEIAEHGAE